MLGYGGVKYRSTMKREVLLLFSLTSRSFAWSTARVSLQRTIAALNYPVLSIRCRSSAKLRSEIYSKNLEHAEEEEAKSLSGIPYSLVTRGLEALYPKHEEGKRNALSRTDGYWPYVKSMETPPTDLTYGEFDLGFFASLLDRARQFHDNTSGNCISNDDEDDADLKTWDGKVFTDIGSGTGRLVLGAAALHQWNLCRGIEILPSIHEFAVDALNKCRGTNNDRIHDDAARYHLAIDASCSLSLSPIELRCGSFDDPYEYFGDSDCIFVFSTCMSQDLMQALSNAVGRQCKPGTLIITTEISLPLHGDTPPLKSDPNVPSGRYEIELVEKISGKCELVGGESTAYIHRVAKSFWDEGIGRRQSPAFISGRLVKKIKVGEMTNPVYEGCPRE